MQSCKRFSGKCIEQLRAEIGEAGGNEVFALGFLDDSGKVVKLRVTARGNEGQVLAIDAADEEADPQSSFGFFDSQ